MYPASIDGILANEKDFLILGAEWAADDGVVVGFDVAVVLVLQETLVDYFFRHFPLVYHHVPAAVVYPESVGAEGLFVVQSHKNTIRNELHVIDGRFLLETVHKLKWLILLHLTFGKLIDEDALGPTYAKHIRRLFLVVLWVEDWKYCTSSQLDIGEFGEVEIIRSSDPSERHYLRFVRED